MNIDKKINIPFNPYNYTNELFNIRKDDILNKYTLALEVGNTNIGNIINIINNINYNPNYKNNIGDTSLHILIKINNNILNQYNKLYIFKILIEKGADITIRNNLLQNILHLLLKFKLYDIINYILSNIEYTKIINNNDIFKYNYLNYLLDNDIYNINYNKYNK